MTKNRRIRIALVSLLAIALLAGGTFISYRVGFSQGFIAASDAVSEDGFVDLPFGFDRVGGESERGERFEAPFGRAGFVRGFGHGPFLLFPVFGLMFVLFVIGAVVATVLLLRRRKTNPATPK